jgi:hypothetical protein
VLATVSKSSNSNLTARWSEDIEAKEVISNVVNKIKGDKSVEHIPQPLFRISSAFPNHYSRGRRQRMIQY